MSEFPLESLLERHALRWCSGTDADWRQWRIANICCDSRKATQGSLFFALKGSKLDGGRFIQDALRRGAVAVVVDSDVDPAIVQNVPVPYCVVADARRALAEVSARFYGYPTKRLLSIGVTGTNGKTSVAWITANALSRLCGETVLVGTLGMSLVRRGEGALPQLVKTMNTTPEPMEVCEFISHSPAAQALVMEVTSQGIVQHRTSAVDWDAAVFTNLTRDHLDLHGTLENYEAIKTSLFTDYLARSGKQRRIAVLNIDDPVGRRIREALQSGGASVQCIGFSVQQVESEAFVLDARCALSGTTINASILGQAVNFHSKLVGRYNVSNLVAACATLTALGYNSEQAAVLLGEVPPVPGRLERVGNGPVHVFVDYAHTPDALENVQRSLRELGSGRLITVFGCGGDRDRGKRPMMGELVAQMSDYAVLTSDNPRTEDPERIIDDIVPGVERAACRPGFGWTRITNREEAIGHAIERARAGDTVLVAGKGHEDYQEINGIRHPFLDQDVCLGLMKRLDIL